MFKWSTCWTFEHLVIVFAAKRKSKETTKLDFFPAPTQKLQIVVKNGSQSDLGWETLAYEFSILALSS